jgi:hypothetical protein
MRGDHAQQPRLGSRTQGTSPQWRDAAQGGPVFACEPAQPFALNSLRCQFLDPAVETAFRKWQAEVMFYKVTPTTRVGGSYPCQIFSSKHQQGLLWSPLCAMAGEIYLSQRED